LRDGSAQVFTDKLNTPSQIAFDKNGDLIVADTGAHQIKKIKPSGEIEIVAGVENNSGFADGDAPNALFNAPIGVAVSENKIFVADTYNDKIRVVENGRVSTLAGSEQGFADAENGQAAKFDTPCGIAVKDGKIIVADAGNRRLRIVGENGKTSTLAGNGAQDSVDGALFEASFGEPIAVAVGNFGEIYVADGNSIRAVGRRFFPMVETISNTRRGFSDGSLRSAKFNRPSGLATDESGNLYVADSENQVLRVFTGEDAGKEISVEEREKLKVSAEGFRKSAAPRWSYNPPEKVREIAGTMGELRGDVSLDEDIWFHNGLDIVGGYGETARFIRTEKVLHPFAVHNLATLRELVRMPTLGYIHIRLGRDKDDKIFEDKRFQFAFDSNKKIKSLRIPRGARFEAGDAIGTLNAMNHVHLIAGRSGAEMNALDALVLPGVSDSIAPVIEEISLFDQNWQPVGETKSETARIKVSGKTRVVARAYDRMDGNAERRRLGVYKLGYQILRADKTPLTEEKTTISFALFPDGEFVRLVYAEGSKSGATGETIFKYIVSNEVRGDFAREDFLDIDALEKGNYILRVFAADYFGNRAVRDVEIIK
jgi:sugar lactone lactonase YvrE